MLGRIVRMVVSCLGLAICCREVASTVALAGLSVHLAFCFNHINKNIVIFLLSIVAACHIIDTIIFLGEMAAMEGMAFGRLWDRFGDRRFRSGSKTMRLDRGHTKTNDDITALWFYDHPDDRSTL